MIASLPHDEVTFFDLETGGTEDRHPTIQIAAVAVNIAQPDWPIVEEFERKVMFDPEVCDPEALKLNHYNPDVWEKEEVLPSRVRIEFGAFLKRHATLQLTSAKGNDYVTAKIAGHNIIRFDLPRLDRLFGPGFKPYAWWRALDTIALASWIFDGHLAGNSQSYPKNLQLGTLCEFFDIKTEGAHDALADVHLTIKLTKALLEYSR